MYVFHIELEQRPQGSPILTAETEAAYESYIKPGCTVALRFREIRIVAQVLEAEKDGFFVGQVVDFDGTLEPDVQGLDIGGFIRFRMHHIFNCSDP